MTGRRAGPSSASRMSVTLSTSVVTVNESTGSSGIVSFIALPDPRSRDLRGTRRWRRGREVIVRTGRTPKPPTSGRVLPGRRSGSLSTNARFPAPRHKRDADNAALREESSGPTRGSPDCCFPWRLSHKGAVLGERPIADFRRLCVSASRGDRAPRPADLTPARSTSLGSTTTKWHAPGFVQQPAWKAAVGFDGPGSPPEPMLATGAVELRTCHRPAVPSGGSLR